MRGFGSGLKRTFIFKSRKAFEKQIRDRVLSEQMKHISLPKNLLRLRYPLIDMVQHNRCFRDYLRKYGVEELIRFLVKEMPELKKSEFALQYLKEWISQTKLADYNIQRYHIKDKITILGHEFNGLEDIQNHCAMVGKKYLQGLRCWHREGRTEYPDIHIGKLYDDYPSFDSYDSCDNRTYQNYIFRTAPITEDNMKEVFKIPHNFNFCMVHEHIPKERLPILYYSGEGEYMLLAFE